MRPGYRLDCCLWRETPPCIFNNLPPKRLGPACLLVSTPIASFQSRHNSYSLFFFSCPFLFPLKRSGRLPPLSGKPKFLSLHLPSLSLYLSFVSLSCFFFFFPCVAELQAARRFISQMLSRKLSYKVGWKEYSALGSPSSSLRLEYFPPSRTPLRD